MAVEKNKNKLKGCLPISPWGKRVCTQFLGCCKGTVTTKWEPVSVMKRGKKSIFIKKVKHWWQLAIK